ncbi:uncharacterized protein LOC135499344 [Lineus longissimus]|uniref:uncharacterized protein LOC135499344 n=1 Tax=Lineus longissimus TaxID=88925 RepID=UPI00315DE6AE
MKPSDRFSFTRQNKLCDNCLKHNHFSARCTLNRRCSVPGCGKKHTKFLHLLEDRPTAGTLATVRPRDRTPSSSSSSGASRDRGTTPRPDAVSAQNATGSVTGAGSPIALPVAPVKIRAKGGAGGVVTTYALLDTGSTNTFCCDSLLDELAVDGKDSLLALTTLGSKCQQVPTKVAALEVMDMDEKCLVQLPFVYSRPELPAPNEAVMAREASDKWPHLRDLDLPRVAPTCVKLLIGQDIPEALLPMEVRQGNPGEPYATKTALGWTLNGPMGQQSLGNVTTTCNFIAADHRLERQLERIWELERSSDDDILALSVEDRRVVQTWTDSVSQVDGHYQLPIPFRDSNPRLSNNVVMAKHRLDSLQRKFERDEELYQNYKTGVEELLSNGFAERVPESEISGPQGKTWYLPHHHVSNPNKDKIRIVFDCSASYKGDSLNTKVLQGPDLTNKLIGVLLRFREQNIAVMADIKAMFHQVWVEPDDRDALRFLWWPGGDMSLEPVPYRMCVHLFGGIWSPSAANFALKQTASDHIEAFDDMTIQSVVKRLYVDDLCKSVIDTEVAIRLADQLCRLLQLGGFRLTKWVSNDREVIASLPLEERAPKVKDLDLDNSNLPMERVLGVSWDPETDSLGVNAKIMDKPLTRRGLLSDVSSVYDPMGIVSPFVMPAKCLIQELCRRGAGWDEPLLEHEELEWNTWRSGVEKLKLFSVNRCFHPCDFGDATATELHHFSDASERAYGSVAYLKQTNREGKIHVTIVFAKSKVAPLANVTIPRLELLAAVEAVKIDQLLRRELDIQIKSTTFWTDSTLVLQFINNESKPLKTFVANRVTYIRSYTSPSQWRHVETDKNPGDDVSRGLTADQMLSSKRWVSGPDFVWSDIEKTDTGIPPLSENCEVKKARVFSTNANTNPEMCVDGLIEYYSSWNRLRRAAAWFLRLKGLLRSKVKKDAKPVPSGSLTVEEIEQAEVSLVQYVQKRAYSAELRDLENGQQCVKKSSCIYSLEPLLDDSGVLCVGGRLQNAPIPARQKHQYIIPTSSHLATLLVRHYHEVSGHSGREYVLSLTRQKFWLPKPRNLLQVVLFDCPHCRRKKARLMKQRMANLPLDRVVPYEPPFSNVGCDCFGPFMVKRARSDVKRYGCIFTCHVTRAIHIEILLSMDTDSLINGLRRFTARRGNPARIRSDNGTNFTGGDNELRKSISEWNQSTTDKFLAQKGIQWVYNPAAASHFGGCWERLIRSVRATLISVMSMPSVRGQSLGDEELSTFMCEVEAIVNGRPITIVSDDVRDMEPLTPNHLLLMRSGATLPPGVFVDRDMYRRKWKQAQYLANIFWERWVKEYLPTLQKRTKWIESSDNLKVGDVVLVLDESTPRNLWPLARVVEIFPGKDGLVRSACVKTRISTLTRPIHKLSLLESSVAELEDND